MRPQITFLFVRQLTLVGKGLHIIEALQSRTHTHTHTHTHTQTPHSVRLLWTSNELVAQTSTSQHTILTTERHPCPSGIRIRNPNKLEGVDPRLSPRALGL